MSDRKLYELLQSTSDMLFPAEIGSAVVTLDSQSCDGDTPLHVFIWRGDTDAVRLLLAAGPTVDAVGDMGQTPLTLSVMRKEIPIARMLIAAGASPDGIAGFWPAMLTVCGVLSGIIWASSHKAN